MGKNHLRRAQLTWTNDGPHYQTNRKLTSGKTLPPATQQTTFLIRRETALMAISNSPGLVAFLNYEF